MTTMKAMPEPDRIVPATALKRSIMSPALRKQPACVLTFGESGEYAVHVDPEHDRNIPEREALVSDVL